LDVELIKAGSRVLLAKQEKGEDVGVEETFVHAVTV